MENKQTDKEDMQDKDIPQNKLISYFYGPAIYLYKGEYFFVWFTALISLLECAFYLKGFASKVIE